ncbi:MAG: restriction endonuclease subunit S [Treponema sp.]|nr:restriction endonuclease subunit S [Treponema sp.]
MATEWKKGFLNQICRIGDGAHASLKRQTEGILYLTAKNITQTGIDLTTVDYIDEKTFEKHFTEKSSTVSCPKEGDILYSIIGSVGGCYIVKKETIGISSSVAIFRPDKNKINNLFLYYYIKSPFFYNSILAIKTGAAQGFMSLGKLGSVEIKYPESLETQQKIAGILSAYDDLIEKNRKQIKLLEEAAQKLYKEWFVKLNFPGHENVKIVDGVPEGWKKAELNTVLSKVTTGLNPRKNFVLGKGNNYYVTIKNMGDNNLYLDDKCDKVDDEALEKINKRSDLQTGDILFSGIGTIGRVYLVSISTDNWDVSESVFTLRANEFISKEFLYLLLLSDDMQAYCDLNAHGAAQRGIRMADLKAYKFALPNSNLITRFTKIIAPYISKAQCLKNQNVSLQTARDKLLPRLMNGDINV